MDDEHLFWRTQSFTIVPTKSRQGYHVDVNDAGGGTLASCDPDGTLKDRSGEALMQLPVRWESHRNQPVQAEVDIMDADGRSLASGQVVRYGIGPRSKKATVAVTAGGREVLRLEPTDKKGERLSIGSEMGEVATISVTEIKSGFLKKSRVYTVEFVSAIQPELRPLVFAIAIRYDALLDAVAAAAMRDSVRD